MNQLQEEVKQTSASRSLMTPTKFEFNMSTGGQDSITNVSEETQNAEYLPLKHFLDNDEEISKTETFLSATVTGDSDVITKTETFFTACVSRATSPPEAGKMGKLFFFYFKKLVQVVRHKIKVK